MSDMLNIRPTGWRRSACEKYVKLAMYVDDWPMPYNMSALERWADSFTQSHLADFRGLTPCPHKGYRLYASDLSCFAFAAHQLVQCVRVSAPGVSKIDALPTNRFMQLFAMYRDHWDQITINYGRHS